MKATEVIELDGKELVTMSNDLARACFSLTKNEMRLLLVAMAQMPKSVKDKDGNYEKEDYDVDEIAKQPFYITKDDFVKLGVDPKNVAHDIRLACSDLMNKKVTIDSPFGSREINWTDSVLHFKNEKFEELKRKFPNSKFDDEFIQYLKLHNLLDSLKFITKTDDNIVARVIFTRSIIPYICQLKEKFVEVNLTDFYGFNSFYSFRIYMLMMTYDTTGKIYIRLDDFRKILDLVDSYKSLKDFKKNVLDIAINEISAKSPYLASYELTDKAGRSGRGIKATNLKITFKKKSKAIDGECKQSDKLTKEQQLIIQSSIDKYIAEKGITDENHKTNIYKKAMNERWGLNEYDKKNDDMNAQNAKVLAQIEADKKAKTEKMNIEEQQKLSNEKFIVHFESLPQLQRNKINEQVKAEVSKIPILGKNFGENSYKDIMFRAYFKTVMNLNN